MDLAKIRKKSLLIPADPVEYALSTPEALPESVQNMPETVLSVTASSPVVFFQKALPVTTVASREIVPLSESAIHTEIFTPLEAILAARTAAGCDAESFIADDATNLMVVESFQEFLCFRVSDEIYGINITDIKEIIKPRVVTEVPRAPAFVMGVLSLRGTIIPIIDMRIRLGLGLAGSGGRERIIVIRNNNSFSGLLVDEVIQVVKVQLEYVEAVPTVLDGVDRDFISGLGRSDGRLIIILNLENITDINLY